MNMDQTIENKIATQCAPDYLEVINESNQHSGAGTETHYKVIVVSEHFANQTRVQRHRELNALLADELNQGVHALSLKLHTPAEWQARHGDVPASPHCRGGSKA